MALTHRFATRSINVVFLPKGVSCSSSQLRPLPAVQKRRFQLMYRNKIPYSQPWISHSPFVIPEGVSIRANTKRYKDDGHTLVTVTGPTGVLRLCMESQVEVHTDPESGEVQLAQDRFRDDYDGRYITKYRQTIQNMVYDAYIGHARSLQIVGVGYRAYINEDTPNVLRFRLGYCHEVTFPIPKDILIEVAAKGTEITIFGCDRRRVRQLAIDIRNLKRPEPYKGKGIRFMGEQLKLKTGKKSRYFTNKRVS
eukprot:398820_1